jgi:chromosome segregation protein
MMRLKELHLFGFKSFPEKTVIKFSDGITAILGPNGCGKTNILDALRWVLGEQNLSLLRCSRNEELIFAGTKNRPPLNFCEVKLLLETEEDSPYGSEIEIKRRYFRNGEMEYFLNRKPCRLKDIEELFFKTGSKAYSLFSLSDIRRIISGEAKKLFDEAANLKKYQENKKEVKSKLELVERDLQRLEDIVRERRRIVLSLRRQKRKWEIYSSLREEEKRLQLAQLLKKKRLLAERLAEVKREREAMENEEDNYRKEMEEERERLEEWKERVKRGEEEKEKIQSQIAEWKERLSILDKELVKSEDRLAFLQEREKDLRSEQETWESGLVLTPEAIKKREEELHQLSEKESTYQKELERLREEVRVLEEEISEKEREKEKNERERIFFFDEIVRVSSELAKERQRLEMLEKERERFRNLDRVKKPDNLLGKVKDFFSFPPEYEKAVESALFPYHTFYLLSDLEENEPGMSQPEEPIGFLIVSLQKTLPPPSERPPLTSLAEITEIKEGCPDLIVSLLKRTFLVKDYAEAKRFFTQYPECGFVTKDGASLRPEGSLFLAAISQTTESLIAHLREEIAQKEKEKRELEERKRQKEEEIAQQQKAIEGLKEKSKEKLKISSELLLNLTKISEEKKVLERERALIEKEMARDKIKEESRRKEIMEIEREIEELRRNYHQKKREEEEIRRLIAEKEEGLKSLELTELKQKKERSEEAINKKREEIENVQKRKVEKQLEEVGLLKEIEGCEREVARLLSGIGTEIKEEELILLEDVEERLKEIERKILAVGKVNPLAKDDFEREKQELDKFLKEKEDCAKAKEDLRSAIQEIDRRVREDFLRTFEGVRENFREIFARLFIEGEGDLILENPDNPIESEITIIAKPQGKNPRRLEQLSDGEKALLSLSLLFAFYKVKPAPFSFLDEIDAPLDDANVERFASYLKEIARTTQVVIITHNRLTLEKVDVLLGVTAEEPGVSKIITMRLKDINTPKES